MKTEKSFFSNRDLERIGLRSCSTSRNLQWKGKDPIPSYKIGGQTKYSVKDVRDYLRKCKNKNSKI